MVKIPMGTLSEPKGIVGAIVYLKQSVPITQEVLHVDDSAHVGQ
jgi:hypothetical protein